MKVMVNLRLSNRSKGRGVVRAVLHCKKLELDSVAAEALSWDCCRDIAPTGG